VHDAPPHLNVTHIELWTPWQFLYWCKRRTCAQTVASQQQA